MPHRTTYFFPRHFPDSGSDSSEKFAKDHGNETELTNFNDDAEIPEEVGGKGKSICTQSLDPTCTGDKNHEKHLSAFVNWLFEKKVEKSAHVKIRLERGGVGDGDDDDDDQEPLVPPESPCFVNEALVPSTRTTEVSPREETGASYAAPSRGVISIPQLPLQSLSIEGTSCTRFPTSSSGPETSSKGCSFEPQLPLQSLSSGSCYAGSLFPGTTLDSSFPSSIRGDEHNKRAILMQKSREAICLQLNFVHRLSDEASLAGESVLLQDFSGPGVVGVLYKAETVSYRLWISGCLSYSDRISDGFYNILGMNPHLWIMCNEYEEGRRLPSLTALKAVEPSDSLMEVVLVDKNGDSRLREIEDKAQELYFASENSTVLVEKLGKLVAIYMGGSFPVEHDDLNGRWRSVSQRLIDLKSALCYQLAA